MENCHFEYSCFQTENWNGKEWAELQSPSSLCFCFLKIGKHFSFHNGISSLQRRSLQRYPTSSWPGVVHNSNSMSMGEKLTRLDGAYQRRRYHPNMESQIHTPQPEFCGRCGDCDCHYFHHLCHHRMGGSQTICDGKRGKKKKKKKKKSHVFLM